MSKLGRNQPCWCGSGKKFKKCHWPKTNPKRENNKLIQKVGSFGIGPLEQTLKHIPQKNVPALLKRIRHEKQMGTRLLPSSTLISIGDIPPQTDRFFLVDLCARLVDENWSGRSEMCIYFATLIRHGLAILGYPSVVELGKARYSMGGQSFEWDHAWVRTGENDIVDGNVDSLIENPFVPESIQPKPYWGPIDSLPPDREFQRDRDLLPEQDERELDQEDIRRWKAILERKAIKQ